MPFKEASSDSYTIALPENFNPFLAGNFRYRAFRGEVSIQDAQVTVPLDRIVEWPDQVLSAGVGGIRLSSFQVLRKGLTCNGHAISVQQAFVEQSFEQGSQASDSDEMGHVVFAAWFEIAKEGNPFAYFREVIEFERTPAAWAMASR